MSLFGAAGIPDEVKEDVGAAIERIAALKGYRRYMSGNDLASFYTDSATATAAQDTMFEIMGPFFAFLSAPGKGHGQSRP